MTKQNLLKIIFATGFLFPIFCEAAERTLIASSGPQRVQLLELYSSESCSSCPAADAWVSDLKDQSGLWKQFVPVVFHVDYWNNLGWTDEFSSRQMTERQSQISRLWKNPKIYTPGMVVDSSEWPDWREAKNHKLPPAPPASGIELSLFKDIDGSYIVKATGLKPHQKYTIRVAHLGMNLSTNVTSGENGGHLLKHNFLVLNWDEKPADALVNEAQFKLRASKQKPTREALAAWIELDGKPAALQAVGNYL